MKLLLLPACIISCLPAYSQVVHHFPSSYHLSGQPFYFLNNQASLTGLKQPAAGVYSEQRFGLKHLAVHLAAAVLPLKDAGLGLAFRYSGFSAYNEVQVSLAYGRRLGRISLGVQCNYTRLSASDMAIGVELSSLYELSAKLKAGIRLANPLSGQFLQVKDEKLASVFQLGLLYVVSEQVVVTMHLVKEEGRALNVVAGIQYTIENKLYTSIGMSTATNEPFCMAGWKWRNCRADVVMRYHQQLGISPGLALVFYGRERL